MSTCTASRSGIGQILLLGAAVLLAGPGCTAPLDPNLETGPDGVDFTRYGGVEIIGIVSKDGKAGEPGPIDLAQLGAALYTLCEDRLEGSAEAPVLAEFCAPATGELGECARAVCGNLVYNCMANELLTLAQSVGVFELETRIRAYYAYLDPKTQEIVFEWSDGYRVNGGTTDAVFSFRIQPLSEAQRAVVYVAARAAARAAAALGAEAATSGGGGGEVVAPDCLGELAEWSGSAGQKDGHGDASLMDFHLHGLGESVSLMAEASEQAAALQAHVATAVLARQNDYGAAQQAMWQGSFGSYGSAIAGILGGEGSDATPLVGGCMVSPTVPGQRQSLDLLRAASVRSIFEDTSIDEVIGEVRQVLSVDPGGSVPGTNDDFLQSWGVTRSDMAAARAYLQSEAQALDRVHTPMSLDKDSSGPVRLHGVASRTLQHPAAYFQGKAIARTTWDPQGSSDEYASLSAAHAIDLVRYAMNHVLKRASSAGPASQWFTTDQKETLARASKRAGLLVGTRRIISNVSVAPEDPGKLLVTVAVYGADRDDDYYFVLGNDGYRCALEGTIDGAPCEISDHLVPLTRAEYLEPPEGVQGPLDASYLLEFQADVSRLVPWPGDLPGRGARGARPAARDVVHLFDGAAEGRQRYLGNITIEPDRAIAFPVIAGSLMDDIVSQITVRQPDDCGKPRDFCGDLGIERDKVPPLENELTEAGGVPDVEDSWRHYLSLARQAAEEADRLGEQLVQAGLEMDLRAESARKELEEICGGVVNLPEGAGASCDPATDPDCDVVSQYDRADPGLETCLPYGQGGGMKRGIVSLGRPLCIFQWRKSKKICSCPEGTEGNGCPAHCPLVAEDSTNTVEECAGQFHLPEGETSFTSGDDTADVIYVDRALHVFTSSAPQLSSVPTWQEASEALDDLQARMDDQSMSDQDFGVWLDNWRYGNQWASLENLRALASGLRFEPGFLHHYTLRLGGKVIWTTEVRDATECPPVAPWLGDATQTDCVYPESPLGPGIEEMQNWLAGELCLSPSAMGYAWKRKIWADPVFFHALWLGVLTGRTRGIQVPGYYWFDHGAYHEDNIVNRGPASRGVLVRYRDQGLHSGEDEDLNRPIMCLYTAGYAPVTTNVCREIEWGDSLYDYIHGRQSILDDPGVAPCQRRSWSSHSNKKHWHVVNSMDYTEVAHEDVLQRFWTSDLASFLRGDYPPGFAWQLEGSSTWSPIRVDVDESGLHTSMSEGKTYREKRMSNQVGFQGEYDLDRHRFINVLRFAAFLLTQGGGALLGCDPEEPFQAMPRIQSVNDLIAVQQQINCVADSIQAVGEKIYIPNLPTVLVEGFQETGIESYYPGYQGENLKVLLALEADLERFRTAAAGIQDVLRRVALQVESVRLAAKKIGIQRVIGQLQTMVSVVQAVVQVASAAASNPFAGAATAGFVAQNLALQFMIGGLKEQEFDIDEMSLFNQAMSGLGDRLTELRGVYTDMIGAVESIQTSQTTLDRLQNRASEAYANMLFLDQDSVGHVLQVNTVMRRRQNTIRIRYQKALARARKLAFIARRAIEARLGVDMSQMESDMSLVPAPSTWADRVCTMQGFDYQRLRDSDPDDPLLDPELQSTDAYAHWYIGDYVQMLSDFVESYNLDYPFTDDRDVAVISVRDDIIGARDICERQSYNYLYWSGDVGTGTLVDEGDAQVVHGWVRAGCVQNDACLSALPAREDRWCDESFCFGEAMEYDPSDPEAEGHPAKGVRLRDPVYQTVTPSADGTTYASRGTGWENTGYFAQQVSGVPAGRYLLSWYDHRPAEATSSPAYRVELWDLGAEPAHVLGSVVETASATGWVRRQAPVVTLPETTDLEVRIYPSDASDGHVEHANDPGSVRYGDVAIWGVQLEWVHPSRCGGTGQAPDCSGVAPLGAEETGSTLTVTARDCVDHDGSEMRRLFVRRCVCPEHEGGRCPEDGTLTSDRRCFYEYAFSVTLEGLDSGKLIPSNNIAQGNFNYRLEALAVNVVGTNVVDCTHPWSTPTCYTNAFVPYTLEHQGTDLPIRNHEGSTLLFDLPTARVEHGKGLAAEVVLTNPLTSTHSQLLSEYWKDGIRGRPLQGTYILRIWETPDLVWDRVEDIQLLWKYRYWTRSY